MNKKIEKGRPELNPIPVKSPWYHLGIDFVGPISPPSSEGNRYILTVSDYYPARACASKGLCDRSWCLLYIYPARACAARGKVISRGWWCPYVKNLQFFWNQSFISQNTHFQSSISTQTGFSSNLMASGTA